MAAEMWFRNPSNYVRELKEANEHLYVFDYGWLVQRRIDVAKWIHLHFGNTGPARVIAAGAQGAAEYMPGNENPVAVYPVWQYGDNEGVLEGLMESNVGESLDACGDLTVERTSRPVYAQEHRVMVMNFPEINQGPGRQVMSLFKELQEEYPDCILHIHGLNTFSTPARMGFKAFDFDPRTPAQKGTIYLPSGRRVAKDAPLQPHKEWLSINGYKPIDMQTPANRCIQNIKAARWAADHSTKDLRMKMTKNVQPIDTKSSDEDYDPEEDNRIKFKVKMEPRPGDMFLCNSCSLAMGCKFYREGAVCSVPKSESVPLANYFKSRDAETIMDGLGKLMEMQVGRVEKMMQEEDDFGISKDTTKAIDGLMDRGMKLAKLRNPELNGPQTVVNVGGGAAAPTQISQTSIKQAVANASKELELQGIPRAQQTPEMIENILRMATGQPRVIQANPGEVALRDEESPF